jgi:hypothetical protein
MVGHPGPAGTAGGGSHACKHLSGEPQSSEEAATSSPPVLLVSVAPPGQTNCR